VPVAISPGGPDDRREPDMASAVAGCPFHVTGEPTGSHPARGEESAAKPAVRELLTRDGVLDRIGSENIHGNIDHAVAA
jgi:hypothetical protein